MFCGKVINKNMVFLLNIILYRCEYIERCLREDTFFCSDFVFYECDSYMIVIFYFDSNFLGFFEMYKMGLKVLGVIGEVKFKVRY